MKKLVHRFLPPFLAGLSFLLLWYLIKAVTDLHDLILPYPHQVILAFPEHLEILSKAFLVTATGSFLGFCGAIACGFMIALLLSSSEMLRRAVYPYILFVQMIPILSTAAMIVILFGVGLPSVALIAFLIGFFPVVANTLHGLLSTSPAQEELFQIYGATSSQSLFWLRIPHALPSFFTGARIAATLAVIGAVTGEIFAGTSDGSGGLGFLILVFKSKLQTAGIYAATLLCCALGFIFVFAVGRVEKSLLKDWHNLYRERA